MASLNSDQAGIDKVEVLTFIETVTNEAKAKLTAIKDVASIASIGDMFDMQMIMNRLSQASEMATSVMSAANTAIMSMARNVKG